MNNVIDADAAKLAGLQIDTLQKVRSGQITLGQWERFNNLSTDDREARFGDWKKPEPTAQPESVEKFALHVDLGIITVPDDYVHEKQLTTFREQSRKKFYYYSDAITDKNFPNPTRVLKPGNKFHVRAFKQVVGGTTTSEERLAFLATQKAIHVGAQGTSLVFDQKRDQLPKGRWYASLDEKDRLWVGTGGNRKVPGVLCHSTRDSYEFLHRNFERDMDSGDAFLCFTEVEDTSA